MTTPIDQSSALGKAPAPEKHVPLIVIGAGPAGISAATTAAKAGIVTMLIDENPVGADLIALDVPLHYGQRADAAVQNRQRMIERVVEGNPKLMEAVENGVDVVLGTYVFSAFINGETVHSLTAPMLGLADDTRSWMVSFDRLIIAAGARDLAIGFQGWEKPGVMGAQAWAALTHRYHAFGGRRLLVLGSGAIGLRTAIDAIDSGFEVAGIVEVGPNLVGPVDLQAEVTARSIPTYLGHAVKAATGASEVDGAVLVRVEGSAVAPQDEINVACDTIVYALGAIPTIELLNVLGCRLEFHSEKGGHVPVVSDHGASSIPGIYAVGDCAGFDADKLRNSDIAEAEGRSAALAVTQSLGVTAVSHVSSPPRPAAPDDFYGYWQSWSQAEIAASGWEVHVCQCEEVTRSEIADLRPPRYLAWQQAQSAGHNLRKLNEHVPINQDQVKRLTRAGMGPCQGRRCREQVQLLLSSLTDTPAKDIPLATYRGPVRPLPLHVFAQFEEAEAVRANWVAWFNIPSQWTPHWEIDHAALETGITATGIADK